MPKESNVTFFFLARLTGQIKAGLVTDTGLLGLAGIFTTAASDRHWPVGAGWHIYHSLLAAPATPQLFLQDSAEKANLNDL